MSAILPDEFPFNAKAAPDAVDDAAPDGLSANESEAKNGTAPQTERSFPFTVALDKRQNGSPAITKLIAVPAPGSKVETFNKPVDEAIVAPVVKPTLQAVVEEPLIEVERIGQVIYRGKERRRSPRQSMRGKAMLSTDASPIHFAVQVLNICMMGVRFFSPRHLTENDRANIRIELGPVKWASRLRVVCCTELSEGGYSIGCQTVTNELARKRNVAA